MAEITGYRRPLPGTQPDYLFPDYASTIKRAPTKPLVRLPHTLTELTGPVFGHDEVKPADSLIIAKHHLKDKLIVTFPSLVDNL